VVTRSLATLVITLAVPALASAQTSGVLAHFSPQRAYLESAAGKASRSRLEALEAERAKEIGAREQAIRTRQDVLDKGASVLSEAARVDRAREIERFKIELDRFIEDAQTELVGVRREVETAFLAKLRPVLESVSRSRGLQLVFNADAGYLAWADPTLDITPAVIEQLDRP
jgi:outer membrane protein